MDKNDRPVVPMDCMTVRRFPGNGNSTRNRLTAVAAARHPSGRLRIVFASRSFAPANPSDSADAGKSVAFFMATFFLSPSIITELDRFAVFDWLLVRFVIHNMLPSSESVAGVCLA
jgi:hypothetical protein